MYWVASVYGITFQLPSKLSTSVELPTNPVVLIHALPPQKTVEFIGYETKVTPLTLAVAPLPFPVNVVAAVQSPVPKSIN